MSLVSFTLNDEGVVAFQNILACILRFSEDVSLDAKRGSLVLSALNSSKTAFVSFTFASKYFSRYRYHGDTKFPDRFYCVLFIRALLSIFRSRAGSDTARSAHAESSIEKCDISISDGSGKKSRFVAQISWRNGITATHSLPFEGKAPTHAMFDNSKISNRWSIYAPTLRRMMDHFGPKVELLDINTEGNNVVNLTCFTEKQFAKTDGLLNMNLRTSIAVKMDEFDMIDMEDKHHIIINVRDFRAILQHACTTSGSFSAHYSDPWRPLKLFYEDNGMLCEYILVTSGSKSSPEQKKNKSRSMGGGSHAPLESDHPASTSNIGKDAVADVGQDEVTKVATSTARQPVAKPSVEGHSGFEMRPPPPPAAAVRIEASLEEDSQWEPVDPEEANPGYVQIEWDESLQPEWSFVPIGDERDSMQNQNTATLADNASVTLEPTQRLTQVRKFGLFE